MVIPLTNKGVGGGRHEEKLKSSTLDLLSFYESVLFMYTKVIWKCGAGIESER